jgi:hypothetical protein
MGNLRAEIENLDSDLKIQYVFARCKTTSNNKAVEEAGFSQSTFYGWDQEERDYLNSLAMRLKTEAGLRAMLILQEYAEDAARGMGKLMKSRNENIQLKANQDILDRTGGKPTQRVDQKTEHDGEVNINVRYVDDGD